MTRLIKNFKSLIKNFNKFIESIKSKKISRAFEDNQSMITQWRFENGYMPGVLNYQQVGEA